MKTTLKKQFEDEGVTYYAPEDGVMKQYCHDGLLALLGCIPDTIRVSNKNPKEKGWKKIVYDMGSGYVSKKKDDVGFMLCSYKYIEDKFNLNHDKKHYIFWVKAE